MDFYKQLKCGLVPHILMSFAILKVVSGVKFSVRLTNRVVSSNLNSFFTKLTFAAQGQRYGEENSSTSNKFNSYFYLTLFRHEAIACR